MSDKVVFLIAEEGTIKISGCNGVEKNVMRQRNAGVEAYGLVDRDAIEDMDLACEPNDEFFIAANHHKNPYIYYTIRWELENYLIDPNSLEQERVNAKTRGAGKRTEDLVIAELLTHCEILIAHAAANALLQFLGKPKIGDGFGMLAGNLIDFENLLFSGPFSSFSQALLDQYEIWKQRISSFDLPNATPKERVFAVCRRVHGKALLERFFRANQIQDDKRFSLACRLAENVPSELRLRMTTWAGS